MEILDIVDNNDHVVGQVPYEDAYKNKHTIRIVHIFLFTKKGELVIQQRGFYKPKHGGTWMSSAGGHVMSGESYEDAAKRELQEELGIDVPLTFKKKQLYVNGEGHKKFFALFTGTYAGQKLHLHPKESLQAKVVSYEEIKEMIKRGDPFHPEFLAELDMYFTLYT